MTMPEGSSVFWRKDKKRWVLSYADPARGQPQNVLPKEITNQRAAEQWARAWLDAAGLRPTEALAQRRDEGPTVALCADRWLALLDKDSRVAPATLAGNRGHLRNHILPIFGARSIAGLEVPELRSWLRTLREKIKGASTVRNIYYTMSSLYAAAMAEGWVRRESNVVAHPGVKKEVPELDDSREVIRLPVAWVQTLIESPVVPLERRARYCLAFTSGMRDGEIAGARLKFLQLDADVPVLKIVEAVAMVGAKGKGGFAKAKAPKTKKSKRTLPLHPATVAALREWLKTGWIDLVGRAPGPEDFLFPGLNGRGARPRSAQLIRDDLAAVGLPIDLEGQPIDFKATRSSFSSWLDGADVPRERIKRLLGHAAHDVTEAHYTKRDLEQLMAAVLVIRLVWTPGLGTRPVAMTGGTSSEGNPTESLEPLSRLELETYGLRKDGPSTSEAPSQPCEKQQKCGYSACFCDMRGGHERGRDETRWDARTHPPG
ncbi:MAG: tyrosine-type recombinase/integrase [Byssovorax sp.]